MQRQTHLYTEANTRRQTHLHEKTNAFTLYLVADEYCTCIPPSAHPAVHVPPQAIQEHAKDVMTHLDLPLLLSRLREKGTLSKEQLERLADPAHSAMERVGYLIRLVKQLQQRGVDIFLQCLKETSEKHSGHRVLLELLEGYANVSDHEPVRSPLLEVFDTRQHDILARLNFNSFVNKMAVMGAITVQESMDVHSPYRSTEGNVRALLALLSHRPGGQGLLKFIECLQVDSNSEHETLCTILLREGVCKWAMEGLCV